MTTQRSKATQIKEEFRRRAMARYPGKAEAINEYIAEAEHSDGIEYWVEYGGVDKLVQDFAEYLRIVEDL